MAPDDLGLTPELLRMHASKPDTPFWVDEARQLLRWAADVIEAADCMVNEQSQKNGSVRATCADGSVHTKGGCNSPSKASGESI